ncbi:MAG: molecular chaperone DnaJ [Maribacter sp.]
MLLYLTFPLKSIIEINMAKSYYDILGVPKDADEKVIKKAYRKLAMKYHPDRNPDDKEAEAKFKEAAESYETLRDVDKKSRYDRMGHAGYTQSQQGGGGGGGFRGGMSMEDIFSQFGDIFGENGGGGGNPFESFFGGGGGGGGGRGRRPSGQRGSNARVKVKLTLEEVAKGVTKKIKIKKNVTCDTCSGSGAKDRNAVSTCSTCRGAGYVRQVKNTFLGQMQTTAPCPTCSGTGQEVTAKCETCKGVGATVGDEVIEINIPAGVSEGIQLSMGGKGHAGKRGGPSGDLIITIEEIPHDSLKRDGQNIIYDLYMNFADAALGSSVDVPTIDGLVKIKIPPGTQSGKIFRLRGKGLPGVQSYGTGDQLVHVNIWTPKKLETKERQLLEKLRDMPNFKPNPGKSDKGFFEKMKDMFA